jgi:hypothetical protein
MKRGGKGRTGGVRTKGSAGSVGSTIDKAKQMGANLSKGSTGFGRFKSAPGKSGRGRKRTY